MPLLTAEQHNASYEHKATVYLADGAYRCILNIQWTWTYDMSPKNCHPFYTCDNNSVKCQPILPTLGRKIPERI